MSHEKKKFLVLKFNNERKRQNESFSYALYKKNYTQHT